MNKKVISVYDDSNKRLVKNTGLFSYLYVGSYGGITMWGFIVALVSGALMSIQGVFNTDQPVGIYRLGPAFSLCRLCACMAFYRQRKYCCIVAGGK